MIIKPLNLSKPVQTKSGCPARIICIDRKTAPTASAPYPVVALIDTGEYERLECYTLSGASDVMLPDSPNDLINVPNKRTGWLNIYGTGTDGRECFAHPSRGAADAAARPNRIDCVRVDWTE